MWPFKKRRVESTVVVESASEDAVPWTDILDPHGDGTIRPGDAMWDAMMLNGNPRAVMGNFDDRKGWEIEEVGE